MASGPGSPPAGPDEDSAARRLLVADCGVIAPPPIAPIRAPNPGDKPPPKKMSPLLPTVIQLLNESVKLIVLKLNPN
jgi:hypothetical protein